MAGTQCASFEYSVGNIGKVTVPVTAAVAAGRTLVLCVNAPALNAITNFTVTDTKGNVYTQKAFATAASLINCQLAILTSPITTALSTSDTFEVTAVTRSPGTWCVAAVSFDDIAATAPFDQVATGNGTGSTLSVTTPATTSANEVVIAAFGITSIPVVTPDASFISLPLVSTSNPTGPRSLFVMYKYVSAIAAQTASLTLSAGQGWGAAVTTFKTTVVAPPVVYNHFVIRGGIWVPATRTFG